MADISEALAQLGAAAVVHPTPDLAALGKMAPPDCPPRWRESAELLLRVSGGRGLPVLGEYDFGPLSRFDCSLRRRRWEEPGLVIGRHTSGRPLVLHRDGSVYLGKFERALTKGLATLLERVAAERWPSPARYPLFIHARRADDARKLARKLRVDESSFASEEHDPCWSDERFHITRDRVAARSFALVHEVLAAASSASVEIGLHDGRAEALLSPGLQPIPESPQYHISGGLAEIAIRLLPGERIEQALHYGPEGTEWAEWEAGELVVQRRAPSVQGFEAHPEALDYLSRRRAQRLTRYRRSEAELRARLGDRAWESVIALERDHGGLITEDDLGVWNLLHIAPLVAPGYLAESLAQSERIERLRGEPVIQVGKVEPLLWLCVDRRGRFYTSGLHEHDLEAAGDDLPSAVQKLALDEAHRRRRTDASLGAFLDEADADRLVAALGPTATTALDTFGHRYLEGPGFDLRRRKAAIGEAPRSHLVADSARRFADLLRRIADPRRPLRALQDTLSFPTGEEIGMCERAGIALSDH